MKGDRISNLISSSAYHPPPHIVCAIVLLDDDVYEGPEDLMLRLNTNSSWVVLARARAKVIITDEEDGKR